MRSTCTVKERLLKLVLLTMTRLPRGVRTGPALLAPAPDQLNFEQERAAFLAAATRFAQHPGPLLAAHPFLAPSMRGSGDALPGCIWTTTCASSGFNR